MANILTKIPSKIMSAFKNMSKGQRTRIIVLAALIIVIVIAASAFVNQKNYTVLYSGMDPSDAGEVLAVLTEKGVDAKADGNSTILIDAESADTVRMELAAEGYPSSGVSYDIFQNAAGLGVTDMEKQVYYQFQLQENLRQTIVKMDKVEDAVVNIDLGEESSYVLSDDNKVATASVMLTLKNDEKLGDGEVKAIGELVSNSISGLAIEDVRIIDSQMNLYSVGGDNDTASVDTQMGLQSTVQQQLQTQVTNLLTPVFGADNILAEVNVTLNFDTKVTESVELAPPAEGTEGIVVSMKELVEAIGSDSGTGTGGVTGIDANGTASEYLATLSADDNSVYYNISREANYEVNETKTQIEQAKGQIEDLSVSVIVNSDGAEDYTDQVKSLVATAIGVDPERVTVEMLPFLQAEDAAEVSSAMQIQQEMLSSVQSASTMRLVIIAVAGIIVVLILFMIVKMFRKKGMVAQTELGINYLADEEIIPGSVSARDVEVDLDLDNMEDEDNKLSILENYINKNPESVANLLRNWLNEE